MEGTVCALFVTPQKKATPVKVDQVQLTAKGFAGDFHERFAGRRQILMLSHTVLKEFELPLGALSENMVVDGLDVMALEEGQRVSVGDAILEVTIPCEPCVQMERIRQGLKRALDGKRGMFASVLTPGTIRVGDAVKV